MLSYILRRLLLIVPTLFGILLINFIIIQAAPGGPVEQMIAKLEGFLVLGDALAIALLEARGFTAEDFAFSHPGGALGRRLLLKVEDVMHVGEGLPQVLLGTSLTGALMEMTRKGLGMTVVLDEHGKLAGIFTDGDLRRALDRGIDVRQVTIDQVMTVHGKTVRAEILAAEALKIMEDNKIGALVVVDADDRPVGALNMHDLLRAGVM